MTRSTGTTLLTAVAHRLRSFFSSDIWRTAAFRRMWGAHTLSEFGSAVTVLALPLTAILTLDASPVQMSVLTTALFLPNLLFSLFVGPLVDRRQRRSLMIWMDVARALLLLSIPVSALSGILRIEQLYVVAFLIGALSLVFDMAATSYLPALVKREQLIDANSKLEVSRSSASVIGPGVGAVIQVLTAPIAIAIDAASYLASAVLLLGIRSPEPSPNVSHERTSVLADIREGVRMVVMTPVLRALAGTTATFNFFDNMIGALYILFLTRELDLDPVTIGLLMAVGSVTAIGGSLFAAAISERFPLGPTVIAAFVSLSLASLVAPLVFGPHWVIVGLLIFARFFAALGGTVYNINQLSLRQAITPPDILGRVSASNRFLIWGPIPVGALLGGFLAETIGLRETMLAAAIFSILGIVWLLMSPVPKLRTVSQIEDAV